MYCDTIRHSEDLSLPSVRDKLVQISKDEEKVKDGLRILAEEYHSAFIQSGVVTFKQGIKILALLTLLRIMYVVPVNCQGESDKLRFSVY
jgi:hypothetical protein